MNHCASVARVMAAQEDAAPAKGPQGLLGSPIMLILVMIAVFWFIIMRPQRKEKQERQQRLDTLKKGDKVISIGGIHGKVVEIDQNQGTVTVEVAPKSTMKFSKAAIQTVNRKDTNQPPAKGGDETPPPQDGRK